MGEREKVMDWDGAPNSLSGEEDEVEEEEEEEEEGSRCNELCSAASAAVL